MWNWIAFLGPPILVIVIARRLRKRQDDIDALIEHEYRDPPAGGFLSQLGGGKFG
jgi:hypothetical protein